VDRQRERGKLGDAFELCDGFGVTAKRAEKLRPVAAARVGVIRIELERAVELAPCARPIPLVSKQDAGNYVVGISESVVELERAERKGWRTITSLISRS
jgi:hypothetical protein